MKYFFFDIDGTLTNIHTGEFVPSAIETIDELKRRGHFVAIATGRAYYKASHSMAETHIHNMVCNGGACLVINDEKIVNQPLDHDRAVEIIGEARSLGYGVLVAPSDSIDVVMKDRKFLDQVGERKEPTNYIMMEDDQDFKDLPEIFKIYISIPEEEEYRLTKRDLLGHMRFEKEYLMYQHDMKDVGIKNMIEYLHGDDKDVVVFGDGENDMVMFREEWTSIAMGNGFEALKEKADYITDASEDDGIRNACRHFGWID